jgi:cation diffusion facilitator family transporter
LQLQQSYVVIKQFKWSQLASCSLEQKLKAPTDSTPTFILQVFLHILADTLGSVGVIISAILMWLFDWMIADPICSIFIAIMIALSVFSLIADSVEILMQRQPRQLDGKLQECYDKVSLNR